MTNEIIDPCVYCGLSTAFGFGRFVNRIPVMTDDLDGYGCAECSGFICSLCGKQIYLDEEISTETGDYHETCFEKLDKK